MIKWIKLTLKKTGKPAYIKLTAIVAVVPQTEYCGTRIYTIEGESSWEVTETAEEVMKKIQEVDE